MVPFDNIQFTGNYGNMTEVSYQVAKRAAKKGAKYYHITRQWQERGGNVTISAELNGRSIGAVTEEVDEESGETARGYSYPTAREAALKLMETSYLSAQAFSGADLLHGPLATVDPQVPVLAISVQGLEANPGFSITPGLLHPAIQALATRSDLNPRVRERLIEVLMQAANDPQAREPLKYFFRTTRFLPLDTPTRQGLERLREGAATEDQHTVLATAMYIAQAIERPGGQQAVQLKVAEKAVEAYSLVASEATTTLVVPSNMTEVSALITSAMKMVQAGQQNPASASIQRP